MHKFNDDFVLQHSFKTNGIDYNNFLMRSGNSNKGLEFTNNYFKNDPIFIGDKDNLHLYKVEINA